MPLFMDFHKMENVTIENVRIAHTADLAIQEQYGVRYIQFWVNEEAGTVFCLTEGPDKETCQLVHQLAHGNLACSLTEVEPGYYKLLMGDDLAVDHGLVMNREGDADAGYRTFLAIAVCRIMSVQRDLDQVWSAVTELSLLHKGRNVQAESEVHRVFVFDNALNAAQCAAGIQRELPERLKLWPGLGISASQPVTAEGDFFRDAINTAIQLANTSGGRGPLASSLVARLLKDKLTQLDRVRIIEQADERFLMQLYSILENDLSDPEFTIDELCRKMAISRPQLYRRISALTERAPVDLLRDMRLQRSLHLLKSKWGNITQVAMEVGFNSPSYFSHCFLDQFGCTPSAFIKSAVPA
jgi:AraC-like DNA-binding protein